MLIFAHHCPQITRRQSGQRHDGRWSTVLHSARGRHIQVQSRRSRPLSGQETRPKNINGRANSLTRLTLIDCSRRQDTEGETVCQRATSERRWDRSLTGSLAWRKQLSTSCCSGSENQYANYTIGKRRQAPTNVVRGTAINVDFRPVQIFGPRKTLPSFAKVKMVVIRVMFAVAGE